MKKVLIITYYWPPSGGAGVQRWLKFAKYLPQFGIEPVVLTVDAEYASYAQKDESLMAEVNDELKVYHTKSFELYQLYSKLIGKKEIPYGGFANESKPGLFQKTSRFVRGNLLLPDPRRGWGKYAIPEAIRLIEEYQIDTVITTSPPHSTQLLGRKIKQKTGVRWIADLRDPWTDIYYYKQFYHTAIARWLDKRMERKVMENADQLISVSKDVLRLFNEKTEQDLFLKSHVLPNGYDEDDFRLLNEVKPEKFTITYTGTISEIYDIDGLTKALAGLDRSLQQAIKVRFVGRVPSFILHKIQQNAPGIELETPGYVDHEKSVSYLLNSSLLLLIIPKVENNEGILTGKFFEYLASRKPILAIGPKNGDLAEIIKETDCGQMFAYTESTAMKEYLLKVINNQLVTSHQYIKKYSRRGLTESLSHIILD